MVVTAQMRSCSRGVTLPQHRSTRGWVRSMMLEAVRTPLHAEDVWLEEEDDEEEELALALEGWVGWILSLVSLPSEDDDSVFSVGSSSGSGW